MRRLFYWLVLACSLYAGVRAGMVLSDPCWRLLDVKNNQRHHRTGHHFNAQTIPDMADRSFGGIGVEADPRLTAYAASLVVIHFHQICHLLQSDLLFDTGAVFAKPAKFHAPTVAEQQHWRNPFTARNPSPGSGISESARLVNGGLPKIQEVPCSIL